MSKRMIKRSSILFLASSAISLPAMAALDPSDPSIINLYLLNEQTSGQLVNSPDSGQFLDTAPTGTPQNHDSFSDAPSDGPAWVSGAAFNSVSGTVGTGTGLAFTRSDGDRTRFAAWMNTSQGNYSNGKSFSLMMRIKPGELLDNTTYNLIGIGSHGLTLDGVSGGGQASVGMRLRDGGGGGETYWSFNSFGVGDPNTTGASFKVFSDTWANVFMIYDANSRLTLAMDDGTNFYAQTSIVPPVDFDTLTYGFSDPSPPYMWFLGNNTSLATGSYDGLIESVVFWDKALSNAEAAAIGLTNAKPTWNVNSSGDWNVGSNWSGGSAPNGVGAEARFYSAISSSKTVYTDGDVTVATLSFNNASTYLITGTGNLTLENNGASGAGIDVQSGTHKINLPLTIASDTVLSVAAGATLKISDPVTINSGKTLTPSGDGDVVYESTITVQAAAGIVFASSTHAAGLTLQGTSTAAVANSVGGTTLVQLDSLSINPGSTVDLANNGMLVTSTPDAIRTLIVDGAIFSSAATATQNVGYADAGGGLVGVLYTLLGDTNLDREVDSTDFNALVGSFGENSGVHWADGDFNYDGAVNTLDFNYTAGNFGAALASPTLGSVVPEPACGLLLAGFFALPLGRRRSR